MVKRNILSALVSILFAGMAFSQNSQIFAGSNIPLFYSLGYEHKLSGRLSVSGQGGLLTRPYDVAILKILETFDTDALLLSTIGEAFSFGTSLQPTLKYHFRNTYLGASYSWVILKAADSPMDLIKNYYGLEFPSLERTTINLRSSLHNAGILAGRSFRFKNPRFSVNLELSVLKTFSSQTLITSEQGTELDMLTRLIDKDLGEYYADYGYLPGVNVFLVYSFGTGK